jgi:hypothetical protein
MAPFPDIRDYFHGCQSGRASLHDRVPLVLGSSGLADVAW